MPPTTKPSKSTKATKKKKTPAPEPVSEEDEEMEEEPAEEEPPEEEGGEEEGDEEDQEEGEAAAKKRKMRANARAKMRGYRIQATKAGIGKNNVILNVTGVEEVRRAAKFRPVNNSYVNYPFDEFERRLKLSNTALPASAAAALVPRVERLRRQLFEESVERLVASGKMTLTASHLLPSVEPIEKFGDFTFILPRGLLTFAQTHDSKGRQTGSRPDKRGVKAGPPILESGPTDVEELRADKEVVKRMKKLVKETDKWLADQKFKKDAAKAKKAAEAAAVAAA
jgi:hypothetical protein